MTFHCNEHLNYEHNGNEYVTLHDLIKKRNRRRQVLRMMNPQHWEFQAHKLPHKMRKPNKYFSNTLIENVKMIQPKRINNLVETRWERRQRRKQRREKRWQKAHEQHNKRWESFFGKTQEEQAIEQKQKQKQKRLEHYRAWQNGTVSPYDKKCK